MAAIALTSERLTRLFAQIVHGDSTGFPTDQAMMEKLDVARRIFGAIADFFTPVNGDKTGNNLIFSMTPEEKSQRFGLEMHWRDILSPGDIAVLRQIQEAYAKGARPAIQIPPDSKVAKLGAFAGTVPMLIQRGLMSPDALSARGCPFSGLLTVATIFMPQLLLDLSGQPGDYRTEAKNVFPPDLLKELRGTHTNPDAIQRMTSQVFVKAR